jgi:hypothetical protein
VGSLLLAPEPGTFRGGDGNGATTTTAGGLADCESRAEALRAAGLSGARTLDSEQLYAAEPALARFERGAGSLFGKKSVQATLSSFFSSLRKNASSVLLLSLSFLSQCRLAGRLSVAVAGSIS